MDLLNKLKNGVQSGINESLSILAVVSTEIQEKVKVFASEMKNQSEFKGLKKDIDSNLSALGERVLKIISADGGDDVREDTTVKSIIEKISALKAKLEAAEAKAKSQKEAEALNAKIGEETKSTEKSEDTTPMPDIASIKEKAPSNMESTPSKRENTKTASIKIKRTRKTPTKKTLDKETTTASEEKHDKQPQEDTGKSNNE
ncbi:MAG: hypothetical protein HQK94_19355 [Nitrospirae bacterium]|nr:hypothetical protein [Nitrospirota bacterium]